MSEDSLQREKRALMRSIINNKSTLANLYKQSPSLDNFYVASAYLEAWRSDLQSLKGVNTSLFAFIDTKKCNTPN